MSFHQFNLDSRLMPGITRAGYVTPTPIQSAALPPALAGHDLIGTAQTGTGKTAAFVLPILHRLLTEPPRHTRALIVTPTRELAEQVHGVIGQLGAGTGIRSATIYGGVGAGPQLRALRAGVEILVACPGRLLDHIGQGHARLGGVQTVVLDEADRMLDMGFLPDVRRILGQLPPRRQTLLFSATMPPEIERLASGAMVNPTRVAIGLSRPVHTVSHALFQVSLQMKTPLLLALLEDTATESMLVFTRTKHRATRLTKQIGAAGYRVTSLHSDRTQSQRQAALTGFRRGDYQIMVATDIAARGIDVDGISRVVNYDMPNTVDDYIHRIGRTGRAQRTGDALTFVTPEDSATVRAVEKMMGHPLPRRALPALDHADMPPTEKSAPRRAGHRAPSRWAPAPTPAPATPPRRRSARRVVRTLRFAVR